MQLQMGRRKEFSLEGPLYKKKNLGGAICKFCTEFGRSPRDFYLFFFLGGCPPAHPTPPGVRHWLQMENGWIMTN